MTDSQMLAQTGSNETQDSQPIFEAYRAEFGVGTLSSSPPKYASSSKTSTTSPKQIPSPTSEVVVPSSDPTVVDLTVPATAVHHNALSDKARPGGPTTENDDPSHWDTTRVALTHSKKQCATLEADVVNGVAQGLQDRVNSTGNVNLSVQVPATLVKPKHLANSSARHDSPQPQSVQDNAPKPLIKCLKPPASAVTAALRKMDYSQQTPTQVNDDRDYSEYCDIVPSSPVNGDTQPASHEPRTLQDDDTGAVNFANISELGRPSSQISEDAGFDNTRGDWRHPDGTSQLNNGQTPHRPHAPTFETPAVPKNPFAARPSIAAPLAGSQLFGQTQFSSAIKHISPTSSRPSPKLFNSISPNLIETSPLKNRANVSSPSDIRTSSPHRRLHDIPETSLQNIDEGPIRAATPVNDQSTAGEMIPESPPSTDPTPRAKAPRSSNATEPMAHYEPMKKSQERKSMENFAIPPWDSDDDSDDAIRRLERRKKIERKKAQAAEEMGRVSFTPKVRRNSAEPSRKKRRVLPLEEPETTLKPSPKTDRGKGQELPPLVDDSQEGLVPSKETPVTSTKATPGNSAPDNPQIDHDGDIVLTDADKVVVDDDMIPATSPAPSLPPTAPVEQPPPSEPELPQLRVEDEGLPQGPNEHSEPSSLPPARKRTTRTYGRAARQKRRNPFLSSSFSDGLMSDLDPKPTPISSPLQNVAAVSMIEEEPEEELPLPRTVEDKSAKKSASRSRKPTRNVYADLPPPMTTRSRRSDRADTAPVTPLASRSVGQIPPTSSSLSILSTTPLPSDKTTPGTQDSPGSERPESVTLPSPRGTRDCHKEEAGKGSKTGSPQPAKRAARVSKRFSYLDSDSTDELHLSPAASVLERSMVHSKSSRSFKQSFAQAHRVGRLFEGMVFAISFSDQFKAQERKKLATKITQSGGIILAEGFQDMFEHSSIMNATDPVMDEQDSLQLTKPISESGFTALIADKHSRKVKYMQALALGLPCLAPQWITTCFNKGVIVDWEPYVLCAGASTVLGNAIRSRILAPYSATEAKLAEVIQQRPRLLDGQRVLVVIDSKKSRNEAKEPYIFLATVLGPSISRVFSTQQARELLLERQKAGTPFDWLYLDKGTGTVDAVLAPTETTGNKKRRRSTAAQPRIENIRVLSDELVIQSLILGRMVEEDEVYT
ncbi:DNA damage checkpoint protein [Fusarium mundagurra]|uniref:DNA damage checkpoint protein n=1 Tax=Fusarium mundagurra TaxID=1567541 RepID=A0A8H5YCM0_9HYPO|nr:DNA damage checkpoint protein [Fusarium mundagurra]